MRRSVKSKKTVTSLIPAADTNPFKVASGIKLSVISEHAEAKQQQRAAVKSPDLVAVSNLSHFNDQN